MTLTRRQFLQTTGTTAAALAFAPALGRADDKKNFTVPKLPYAYDALEPHIDAETMQIHHDRHHQAYVDNLNKALASHPDYFSHSIEDILRNINKVPQEIRQAVVNNGGGHANHTLFWEIMGPNAGGSPKGELAQALDKAFGSIDKCRERVSQAAITRFGSGWGWIVVNQGKLQILSTGNQDSPLMKGVTPILGIDVWEHAYYLKYQNRRADYVKAWWNVVNWDKVAEIYAKAMKS